MPKLPHKCPPACGKKGTICLHCYTKEPISTIDVDQNIWLPDPFVTTKCTYCGEIKDTLNVILHADAA